MYNYMYIHVHIFHLSDFLFLLISDLESVYGNMDEVGLVTLAPELDNSMDVIQHLVSKGIIVSIG